MYLNLLLLCGIFSHAIIGTSADENFGNSSNILVRQKRVISRVHGEDVRISIANVPYITFIKYNNRVICAGSILSPRVVITMASCVQLRQANYKVVPKSIRTDHAGNMHDIIDIRRNVGSHPGRSLDGIALLTVDPHFVRGPNLNFIQLYTEILLPGTIATIFGWGYNTHFFPDQGTNHPRNLRSIQVPIMVHQDCVNIYRRQNIPISNKDICTYHSLRYCGHTDGGAPLVVEGRLAGVHLWTGPGGGQCDPQFPDVFVALHDAEYNQWITTNMQNIEEHFHR